MLITGLLLATKLISAPAKAMVSLENTRKITVNLFNLSRQFISSSITNQPVNQSSSQDDPANTYKSNPNHAIPTSTEYLVHNWLERMFALIQIIVLWHEPGTSLVAISSFLGLISLTPHLELKLYPTIFIAIFVYNLIIVWFRHIWPEIRVKPDEGSEEESLLDVDRWTHLHPQLITIAEFRQMLSNLIDYFKVKLLNLLAIRRQRPIDFSLGMFFIFCSTAIIGREINGFTLIFSIITLLTLAPGIYLHLLSKSFRDYISRHVLNELPSSNTTTDITHTQSETDTHYQHSQLSTTSKTALVDSEITPSTISSQPSMSLFDHLKQVSFLSQRDTSSSSTTSSKERLRSEPVVIKTPNKKSQNNDEEEKRKSIIAQKEVLEDNEEDSPLGYLNKQDEHKTSDDLSSNDTASLIDFEDDQHDGFVIL